MPWNASVVPEIVQMSFSFALQPIKLHLPTPKKPLKMTGALQCVRPAVHPTQKRQIG